MDGNPAATLSLQSLPYYKGGQVFSERLPGWAPGRNRWYPAAVHNQPGVHHFFRQHRVPGFWIRAGAV